MNTFAEVLENVEKLNLDEKETLLSILQKRVSELNRSNILDDVNSARQEYKSGNCKISDVDNIMKEITK